MVAKYMYATESTLYYGNSRQPGALHYVLLKPKAGALSSGQGFDSYFVRVSHVHRQEPGEQVQVAHLLQISCRGDDEVVTRKYEQAGLGKVLCRPGMAYYLQSLFH